MQHNIATFKVDKNLITIMTILIYFTLLMYIIISTSKGRCVLLSCITV